MTSSTPWRPLLSGTSASAARRVIDHITAGLPHTHVGYERGRLRAAAALDVGLIGQGLFWAELTRLRGDEAAAERAAEIFEAASDELDQVPMAPALYAGFLGPAWVGELFEGRIFESEDEDDGGTAIDEALWTSLGPGGRSWRANLIAGLTGCGVYALERLPRPRARQCLERIVDLLDGGVLELPTDGKYRTPLSRLGSDDRVAILYRRGLAHGNTGVIVLLAAIHRAGIAPERTGRLLERAVDWLLELERVIDEPGDDDDTERPLGWCLGDAGVAAGLLVAARYAGRQDWQTAGLELTARAARRPPRADETTYDVGLCHGAAGIAHLFNRIHQATGDAAAADAARRWFEHLLSLYRPESDGTGFFTALMGPHWGRPPGQEIEHVEFGGFLRGSAGVGLALLAATSDQAPDWDRVMLLSRHQDLAG